MFNIKNSSLSLFFIEEWFKRLLHLATHDDYKTSAMSIFATLGVEAVDIAFDQEYFGTTNMVLFLVFGTVLINTYYGIRKSRILSNFYKVKAQQAKNDTEQQNLFLAKMQVHKFDPKRLQFVFFKCSSLLGYLYFVTKLLEDKGTFFDFTTEILCKAPIALFWYYEFRSIGVNSTMVYNKKASIFKIVEGIFEPRIFEFLGNKKIKKDNLEEKEIDERISNYEKQKQKENEQGT